MIWKRAILAVTILLGIILTINSVRPDSVQVNYFQEKVSYTLAASGDLPFPDVLIDGVALSGRWEGPGFAQVYLIADNRKFLIIDTREFPSVLELSAYGRPFDATCMETCRLSPVRPTRLFVLVSGPGVLTIDHYMYSMPMNPTGLAVRGKHVITPIKPQKHSLLLPVILLVAIVLGAHSLSHWCKRRAAKIALAVLFLGAFILLGGMFGTWFFSPTSAVTIMAERASSIIAALGLIALVSIVSFEFAVPHLSQETREFESRVWKELEDEEKEWEK